MMIQSKVPQRPSQDKMPQKHAADWQRNTSCRNMIPAKLLLCIFIEITAQRGRPHPCGKHETKDFVFSPRRVFILSDCNWTRTQNHLVRKRTLNHFAKWLSLCLLTKWFWVRVQLNSLKLQISRLLRVRSSLTFRQL